jgi:hypothetical protein
MDSCRRVFFDERKDVRPHRQAAPFGGIRYRAPFGGIKRDAPDYALVGNGGPPRLVGAFAAPIVSAHFRASNTDSTIVLSMKQTAATVRQAIRNFVNVSLSILNSPQKSGILNKRGLRPVANCYLIAVSISTIKVPTATRAVIRLDIATIHSVTVGPWWFFFLAIHWHLLSLNLALIIILKTRFVKAFSQKKENIFRFFGPAPKEAA